MSLANPQHITLRPHVVFTQDGRTPLDSKARTARLRKSFCKNWWNDRWRDLIRALTTALANEEEAFCLPLGGDIEATIAASPMNFATPLSIVENGAVSAAEEDRVEDETEADALDDLEGGLDEEEFEDPLEDEEDSDREVV